MLYLVEHNWVLGDGALLNLRDKLAKIRWAGCGAAAGEARGGMAVRAERAQRRQQASAAQAPVCMQEPRRCCLPQPCCRTHSSPCVHRPPLCRQGLVDGSSPALAAALQGVTHVRLFLSGEIVTAYLKEQELADAAAGAGTSIVVPSGQALGVVGAAAPPVRL